MILYLKTQKMQELWMYDSIFDLWNDEKKKLNRSNKIVHPKPREIWYIKIWVNVWRELFGKSWFFRPVLVVSIIGNMYFCIPLTTKWRNTEYYIKIHSVVFNRNSFVVISQWRIFDSQRFFARMGILSKQEFRYIKKLLRLKYFPEDS